MKILMVVAHYFPEIASAAHVYGDLAKAFIENGHEVHILTSYPREFNLSSQDIGKSFELDETIDGIEIHRCKYNSQRDNIIRRGIEHFSLSKKYFMKYIEIGERFDVSLFYIPPLPLYYLAMKIKKKDNTPFVLNIQDFHPQELTDVGVLKNRFLIWFMKRLENKAYKNSDFITTLSCGGKDYITERGGDPSRLKHIYNGLILSNSQELREIGDFKKKQCVDDLFLVTYAGILSPFQGLDIIVDAAKLTEDDDILFYIVGDGMSKNHIIKRIRDEKISNLRVMPFQDRDEYFNIIRSSDICLVSLDVRMRAPCIPGKLTNIMAAGKPVIAIVNSETETAKTVKDARSGYIVNPINSRELNETIISLRDNPDLRIEMGLNGKRFVESNMNLEMIVGEYEAIFNFLTSSNNSMGGKR